MTETVHRPYRPGAESPAEFRIALTVNGAERSLSQAMSLADYLASLSLDPRGVVVEHNGTILRDRAAFSTLSLNDGDRLEILHFVGGG